MVFKIYIALSGLFGLYQLLKIKNKFAWIITAILVLGVMLVFIPNNLTRVVGLAFLNFPVFLIIIYSLYMKEFSLKKKVNLLFQAIPMGISQLLFLTDWTWTNLAGYVMIIPIAAFLYTLTSLKNYQNEIGFLLIISSYSISRFALVLQNGF